MKKPSPNTVANKPDFIILRFLIIKYHEFIFADIVDESGNEIKFMMSVGRLIIFDVTNRKSYEKVRTLL